MKWCLVSFYHHRLIEISVFNTTSVDPYQTPCSTASDLGLHRMLLTLLWDAMLQMLSNTSRLGLGGPLCIRKKGEQGPSVQI